ncbi:ghiso-like protein [Myxozyma melibiosi]|uniref:Ghiso-like protein n=1 Tax=Myxozyma melibiosi TaxID=54550 RepID=A0ABR1F8S6_9ASCO
MQSNQLRYRVIRQYKQLLFMGREYPRGYQFFRDKLHSGFMKNRDLVDASQIEEKLRFAEFIEKEIAALYHVRKYRSMKRQYYSEE